MSAPGAGTEGTPPVEAGASPAPLPGGRDAGLAEPGPLVVSCGVSDAGRAILHEVMAGVADVVLLGEVAEADRARVLEGAGVLLARNTARELRPEELPLLRGARLLQFITAGVDYIPLRSLPAGVPVACNGGASAEPMAEHVLAMALAAAKRLLVEHGHLARGAFNQRTLNRMLAGSVCGILGFGGIGAAVARLMRCIGMRIHAVNRRGASEEATEWIGTPDRLPEMLAAADVLVVSAPLTRATVGIVGARELERMKDDATLINVARGELVDEAALYAHLLAHPRFTACIDAWWVEPVRHGRFAMGHPFTDLPNVLGSPHNSAAVPGWHDVSLRRAAENCRRALRGERPWHLIGDDERVQ